MAQGKRGAAKAIVAQENQNNALRLRAAGLSYRAIAGQLNIGLATAHTYVTAALEELAQEGSDLTKELRAIEQERIGMAMRAIASKVIAGDLPAIDRWVRLIETEARLFGLNVSVEQSYKLRMAENGDIKIEPTDYRKAIAALAPGDAEAAPAQG